MDHIHKMSYNVPWNTRLNDDRGGMARGRERGWRENYFYGNNEMRRRNSSLPCPTLATNGYRCTAGVADSVPHKVQSWFESAAWQLPDNASNGTAAASGEDEVTTHTRIYQSCVVLISSLPFHSQLPEQHAANATEALWSAMHMQPAHMSITTQPKCAGSRCGISLPRHVIRPNIIL